VWRVGKIALARLRELGIEIEGEDHPSQSEFAFALRKRLNECWATASAEQKVILPIGL
jgi:hypothetical protein